MKILHTSDWHLGKILYERSMIDDQRYFINNVFFNILNKERPDLIIISGDIFDRQIASIEAIKLFNEFLTKVCKEFKIPIAIITGNHDSPERISVASQILKDSGVYIVSHLDDENKIFTLWKNNKKVNIVMLPYFDLQAARNYLNDDEISLNDAYNKILEGLSEKLNYNEFTVLVSHCFVTGAKNFKSDDSLLVGSLDEVSNENFSKFNYVALGHIHSPQSIGENIRYSGAPLKYSFDEPDKNKTMTLLRIQGKDFSIEEIEVCPKYKMRTIRGEFKEIIENAKLNPSNDYICVELLDEVPIYMPMEQLRVYYPNILTMRSEWIKYISSEVDGDSIKDRLDYYSEKNERYVFEMFLRDVCNIEPEEDDYKIFDELCESIKKEDML